MAASHLEFMSIVALNLLDILEALTIIGNTEEKIQLA